VSSKKRIKINTGHDQTIDDEIVDTPDAQDAQDMPDAQDVVEDESLMPDTNGDAESSEATAEEDEISVLAQLEQAESRAAEYLDSLQRERAAFQNYKKRVERERTEQALNVAGSVLLKLLPTLDDFYRAMEAVPEGERNQWFDGVALIQRKLEQFLANEGVTEIEALGAPFDPAYHEAIGVDPDTEMESGTVTQVLQRGYLHKDRVLRPALVRVAE
jgi:molecular chaperone GrpE